MLGRTSPTPLALLATVALGCSSAHVPRSSPTADTLRVATPGDYAPFATCSKSAPIICEGFDVALVEGYAAHRGLAISFTQSSWATLTEDLRQHDMAIGGITIREERAQVGAFGAPLVRTGKQALMRCDDTERFPDWQSIEASARLVVNLGGGNERFAKAHFDAASVRILETNEAVPLAVRDGEADVFFTDGPEAALLARTHETLCIGLGGKLHDPFELALWFAPGKTDLRADVDRYLDSPAGRKHLRELRSRYQLP